MKILAINCGSSTLKFELFAIGPGDPYRQEQRLAGGVIDRLGKQASIKFQTANNKNLNKIRAVSGHAQASRLAVSWLQSIELLQDGEPEAAGHRVIHGGDSFFRPVIIDDNVINAIGALSELAPLHNQPALEAINALRAMLGPKIPMVAVFDTAFHRTMPERAQRYPIMPKLAARHHIYRYGFHGLAHRYMTERYAAITDMPLARVKIVTLQLGNGCSATAIKNGQSVDTSMGFTPLEGLMMGTRSGDVDPTLVSFIARREKMAIKAAEDLLNTRSGLLGVSGQSKDMRELLAAEQKRDEMATLAIDMFCYRVKKYVGAYLSALNSADAIVFGGGIGENAPEIRARICTDMEWCGLKLDSQRNKTTVGREGRISADDAQLHAYVLPVHEEAIIARDTFACLVSTRGKTGDGVLI